MVLCFCSLSACKTSSKPSFLKRTYHNITAHYNGYFNAKMKIDQVVSQNEGSAKDQYDQLLSIYKKAGAGPETAKGSKAGNQPLDEAIKKASFVIQRHEKSNWTDDCYFEIGRANYYKKDYFGAIESFQYVAGKYKNTYTGNKSYIWLINCYVELQKFQQAESVINIALGSETFPKKLLAELFTSIANYHFVKKNYEKTIEYLEKAIPLEHKKIKQARFSYLTAQLYEKINEPGKAAIAYQKVMKYNPNYDMAFNAKINAARLFESKSKSSKKDIERSLNKMLKDEKNKEFKDQIYFSLANIYENQGNIDKAIVFYKLSSASSINNNAQKGLSFYKIASIYFEDKKYQLAQIFYDSAGTFLAKSHPDYDLVQNRKTSLNRLVDNLNVIALEDSLQKVAKLPEADRNKLIDRTVKKSLEQKAKEEEALAKLKESMNAKPILENEGFNANKPSSTWYFYNTSSVSLGYSEFLKRYGRRTLEDNWRRANKESFASLNMNAGDQGESTDSAAADGKDASDATASLRKKFLNNLPLNENQIQASNAKIAMSLYNVGQFYREDIVDFKTAIKYYETLLKRFPENKLKVETYFHLYRIYTSIPNKKEADNYKNKIITEFPNSIFAKVIIDPKFVSDAEEKNKKAMHFYDSVYSLYLDAKYDLVMSNKQFVDTTYATTSIGPKYAYLYALCKAKSNNIPAFEIALNDLIKNYPSSETATIARETLNKINLLKNPKTTTDTKSNESSPYSLESKGPFMVVISTDDKAILKETKLQTSKFNGFQFSLLNLSVNSELIGDKIQTITVSSFSEINKAKEYVSAINKQAPDVIKLAKGSYQVFVITDKNYKILQSKKDINQYLQFYESNIENNE